MSQLTIAPIRFEQVLKYNFAALGGLAIDYINSTTERINIIFYKSLTSNYNNNNGSLL